MGSGRLEWLAKLERLEEWQMRWRHWGWVEPEH
jgi:hypothetical protein